MNSNLHVRTARTDSYSAPAMRDRRSKPATASSHLPRRRAAKTEPALLKQTLTLQRIPVSNSTPSSRPSRTEQLGRKALGVPRVESAGCVAIQRSRTATGRALVHARTLAIDQTDDIHRCMKAKLLCEGYDAAAAGAVSSPNANINPSLILCSSSDASHDLLTEFDGPWDPFLNQIDTYCGGPSLRSAFTAPVSAFPSTPSLYPCMAMAMSDISISDFDYFDAPMPLPALHLDYASLRHVYTATAIHHLALEIPTLTLSTLTELQILALDHETCAIQALRTENPPPAVTALTAFLFFWVEVWQRGWDAAIPHLRYAQSTVRRRGGGSGTTSDDAGAGADNSSATREVAEFVEAFCRGIPVVLQRTATLEAMPETQVENDINAGATAAVTTAYDHPLNDLPFPTAIMPPPTPSIASSPKHGTAAAGDVGATPRLAYATFHAQRAMVWADGAAHETRRLTKHRGGAPTRYVHALLTVLVAELRALLDRWGALTPIPPELSGPLRTLESPFAAAMKHLGLFLGRKAGFEVALFEAQAKLGVRCVLLFAAGGDAGLRVDAVGVLRRGCEVRRRLAGQETSLGGEVLAAGTAGFGVGVLGVEGGMDMRVVDVGRERQGNREREGGERVVGL